MNIAINGFGRIGRLVFRRLIESKGIKVVAINDLTSLDTLAHLLKYDSTQGKYEKDIQVKGNSLLVDGQEIKGFSETDPTNLPWNDLKVDVVIEATGVFRTKDLMQKHIDAGAKRVLLSSPPVGEGIETIVLGVNGDKMSSDQKFYSNASCTTNCLAPLVKILDEKWGIVDGMMNTTHAYTTSQMILDAPHKDLRRARAAAINLIPTSTGAGKATEMVYPAVKGKIQAMAIRVPVATGSLTEFTFSLAQGKPSVEEINAEFRRASQEELHGILEYNTDPIVSSDIVGNPHSSIFDAELTTQSGALYKVISWYDNEYGYASRLADMAIKIGAL